MSKSQKCTCFYKLFNSAPFSDANQKEQIAKINRLYDEAKYLIEARLPTIIDTDTKKEAIELARIAKEALTDDLKEWEYRRHGLKVIDGPHDCSKLHHILETIADILAKAKYPNIDLNRVERLVSDITIPTEQLPNDQKEEKEPEPELELSEMGRKISALIDRINQDFSKTKKPEVTEMKYGPIPAIRQVIMESDIKYPILKHKADEIDGKDKRALAQYLRALADQIDKPEVEVNTDENRPQPKPSPKQTPSTKTSKSRNKPFDITSLKKRRIVKHQTRGDKLMLSIEGNVEGSSLVINKPVPLAEALLMDKELVLNYLKIVKKKGSNSYNYIVKNNFEILKDFL